ncbi:hypothetical protein NM688_g1819 [Phlebia brevispora]|uniref:Uncharacterized protein n=1 Tax=Phlebia brevispora TaxID=194682 RepID=A0ACC1TAI9_9APHY|nr:hypothetical protein NM688_g1819 [Phlebia brevispora]
MLPMYSGPAQSFGMTPIGIPGFQATPTARIPVPNPWLPQTQYPFLPTPDRATSPIGSVDPVIPPEPRGVHHMVPSAIPNRSAMRGHGRSSSPPDVGRAVRFQSPSHPPIVIQPASSYSPPLSDNYVDVKVHQYAIGIRSTASLNKTMVPGWMTHENAPSQLNPLLCGDMHQQAILIFDLSLNEFVPLHARSAGDVNGTRMRRRELAQPATFPVSAEMTIIIDADPDKYEALQWNINLTPINVRSVVNAGSSRSAIVHGSVFITVHDVLHAIHQTLHKQIRKSDWETLSSEQQRSISRAYKARYKKAGTLGGAPAQDSVKKQGVKWVDYLMDEYMFKGLILEHNEDENRRIVRVLVGR